MRETNANGKTVMYMPKDRQAAAHELGKLSALAASREWERAALVALLVKPGKGRPRKLATSRQFPEDQKQYTITEFTRLGIYGFRSVDSVRAYLKAWSLSGFAEPQWGVKTELPAIEFPEPSDLYGRVPSPEPAPELDSPDGPDRHEDEAEDEEPYADSPSPTPIHERPSPRQADPISGFLKVLDRLDPTAVVAGQPPEQVRLLIGTMESWLESLREAAAEQADDVA